MPAKEPSEDDPTTPEAPKPEAPKADPATANASPSQDEEKDDGTIHSGVFRAAINLVAAEQAVANDDQLQALPGDVIRITYTDERNTSPGPVPVVSEVRAMEGSLGGVRVTRAQISDQELKVRTLLKTASALTNIGNRYKEFGLKTNADAKYQQALTICEDVAGDAQKLGGRILEETYVQLWKIYFEMEQLNLAAAMSNRLQREFPNSEFVDTALLQLASVARKQKQYQKAIGIYASVVAMPKSALRGEGQFGVAECYEEMAKDALEKNPASGAQLFDRAFQEYKKVFDQFPDSGRVGEAVAKMANYYYQQKDYARAIDTFESVLQSHPDAKFLDVILFNYGRCLYRMERKADARRQFEQLIGDFPESPLAPDAKRIVEALRKSSDS
jgi:tetratricopeptide (TPR) repeat protein